MIHPIYRLSYPYSPYIFDQHTLDSPYLFDLHALFILPDYRRLDALEFRMIHEQFPEGTIRVPGCVPVLNRADVYTADDDKVRGCHSASK